jgi:lipopolysaccharide export system permease protein
MSVLARYASRMLFVRFSVVVLSVAGFALVFDLLDAAQSVVRGADSPARALATYAGLRLPSLIAEMMPLAALIAGILTVGDLLRNRELVIVWNGGVSPLGIIWRLLPAGLVLIGLKFAIDDQLTPWSAAQLRSWGVGEYRHSSLIGGAPDAIWFESGDDAVRIRRDAAAVGEVRDIAIFRRDADGLLLERLDAPRAEPTVGGWRLQNVVRRTVGAHETERLTELAWRGTIDLDRIALLAREPRELSLAQLATVIANQGFAIRATDAYETWLHVRIAGAIVPFLLVILAFGVARRFSRTGTLAPIFLRGVGIGFSFLVAEGLLVALAEVGLVSPMLAAWLLPLGLATAVLLPPILAEIRVSRAERLVRARSRPPVPA